jgi:Tol biopolymer transport system component
MNPIITPDGRYVLFASTANNLALTSSNTPFPAQGSPKINVFLRDRTNGTTTLVSINLAGTGGGNGDSLPIELSTNGQFALFESSASDLVPGDTNNVTDVFVRDLVHGTNILVSIGMNGSCANGVSGESAMTPNGRYVAFASTASNLVLGDTNGIQDIFVRDLQTGVTTLASPGAIASPGAATSISSLPSRSDSPQITPDGRYVAFLSTATNLVPGVITVGEVYVRDLTGGVTVLASTNAQIVFSGSPAPASCNHAISDNGQFVAFESFAPEIFSRFSVTTNGVIQRYNLQTGFTDMVYSNAVTRPTGYPLFRNLDMTPDGRFIAFVASTNSGSGIFLWDAQTATTTLVSCDTNNTVPANSVSDWPAVDSSGRLVVFLSTATSLTTNVVASGFHLYLRDLLAGSTILLDVDTNGLGFTRDFMNPARLTPDGRYVAFDCTEETPVTNIYFYNVPFPVANRSLVPDDNNRACNMFLRDLTTNSTELISVRQPALPSQTPAGSGAAPIFSVDTGGRYIAFASAADSLVPNYTNLYRGVFVQDLLGGTNILVSVDTNSLNGADGMSSDPSISGDGQYVVFSSYAPNLTADMQVSVSYCSEQDIFVRNLQTGITTRVSTNVLFYVYDVLLNSYSPSISANGKYVLFRSAAEIATTNNYTGGGGPSPSFENLFWADLQAGTTCALTTYPSGSFMALALTPDGHFVAFYGYSAFDGNLGLYVWDSQAAALIYTNSSVSPATIAISPDGNRIVYSASTGFYTVDRAANANWQIAPPLSGSHAGLQFSGDARFLVYSTTNAQLALDTNGITDVYLYDFVTRSNLLVSQGNPPGAASGPSDSPAISNDGRFVAYRSTATNLVAGATNGLPNVFLYDRQTDTTTLLSFNASGMAGNNRSFAPQFSGDGQTVVFQSWASDLIAQDYNQANDLVAVKIATSNPTRVFAGQMVFAPATLQSPTLTWPAANGKTYQVQFKNSLTDATWQTLSGNTWVSGNQGYATDLAPNIGQRFYRVVAF